VIGHNILLVDDNPDHVQLIQEAFEELKSPSTLHVAVDGLAAMAYLRHEDPYEEEPIPDLILLDLNLPKKDGRVVLEELKNSADFRRIPIAVLTSSSDQTDIDTCYDLGANCYITKPANFDQIIDVIEMLEKFWFSITKLPTHPS